MPLPSAAEGVTAAAAEAASDIVVVYFAIRPACRRLVRKEVHTSIMRNSFGDLEVIKKREGGALTKLGRRSERIRYFFPLFPSRSSLSVRDAS